VFWLRFGSMPRRGRLAIWPLFFRGCIRGSCRTRVQSFAATPAFFPQALVPRSTFSVFPTLLLNRASRISFQKARAVRHQSIHMALYHRAIPWSNCSQHFHLTMPSRLNAPVLTVDVGLIHKVDTRNVENLFSMWTGERALLKCT
jgi:hypothetical protein